MPDLKKEDVSAKNNFKNISILQEFPPNDSDKEQNIEDENFNSLKGKSTTTFLQIMWKWRYSCNECVIKSCKNVTVPVIFTSVSIKCVVKCCKNVTTAVIF